jgi:pyridoxine 4-dehydrogenase
VTAVDGSRFARAEGIGRIGFGAMKLTGPRVWGEYPDRAAGLALLRTAVEEGVDFIDTADVYGPHTNEALIRDALHPYPAGLRIATKGGFVRGGPDYATLGAVGHPEYLRQSARMSARRLGVEAIDLYYLHSGRATDAPFEDQVAVLADLRAEGLVRHVGLSNVTLGQLRTAQRIVEVSAVTAQYNVTVRTGADLLRAAEEDGLAFSPWHPVTLTDGPPDAVERAAAVIAPIAAAHRVTPQQVALAWQLARSPVTLPIPGTTSAAHLRENLAAGSVRLTGEEAAAITAVVPEP